MTNTAGTSVHASAVLVGNSAVLIRGKSGTGKSRLAFDLILAGRAGQIPPTLLVGDDRVHLHRGEDQLIVRPARELAGLIEIRGLGIRRCEFVGEAIVALVVDLSAADAERLPPPEAFRANICGINIPRIPVGSGQAPLPLVVAALTTAPSSDTAQPLADCSKGIGNHIRHSIATE
jgi:HPr kinase/phosphorylase